jgi:hypothetical protein
MARNTRTANSEGGLEAEAKKEVARKEHMTREEAVAFADNVAKNMEKVNHPAHPYKCEKGGQHVPNSRFVGGIGYPRAYCWCKKCGRYYEQPMNAKEQENYEKLMNTPFTI